MNEIGAKPWLYSIIISILCFILFGFGFKQKEISPDIQAENQAKVYWSDDEMLDLIVDIKQYPIGPPHDTIGDRPWLIADTTDFKPFPVSEPKLSSFEETDRTDFKIPFIIPDSDFNNQKMLQETFKFDENPIIAEYKAKANLKDFSCNQRDLGIPEIPLTKLANLKNRTVTGSGIYEFRPIDSNGKTFVHVQQIRSSGNSELDRIALDHLTQYVAKLNFRQTTEQLGLKNKAKQVYIIWQDIAGITSTIPDLEDGWR